MLENYHRDDEGDIFVLHEGNVWAVTQNQVIPKFNKISKGIFYAIIIGAGIVSLVVSLALIGNATFAPAILIIIPAFIGIAYFETRRFLRNERLSREGTLVDGIIQEAWGDFVSYGRGNSVWSIWLTYAFTAPDGTFHTGQETVYRLDLNQYVPPKGTRIKVAYVDPKLFRGL